MPRFEMEFLLPAQLESAAVPASHPAAAAAAMLMLLPAKLSGEFLSILNQESSRKSSERERKREREREREGG